jgi:hypothetical protein
VEYLGDNKLIHAGDRAPVALHSKYGVDSRGCFDYPVTPAMPHA